MTGSRFPVRAQLAEPGSVLARQWLARNRVRLGREEEALETARRAVEPSAGDCSAGPGTREDLAFVSGATGWREDALAILREVLTVSFQDPTPPRILTLDPSWGPIREDPAFRALLASREAG